MYKLYRTNKMALPDPNYRMVSHTKGAEDMREGFSSRSVDLQTGTVTSWEILYALMNTRSEYFVNINGKDAQFPCFLLTSDVVFSPDACKLLRPKVPVTIETEIKSLRTVSGCFETNVFLTGDLRRSLVRDRSIFVCVDMETRKAVPIPDFFLARFKDLQHKDVESMPAIVKLVKPTETECQGAPSKPFVFQVARRHLDPNGHVNILYYLQSCIDALEIHLRRNKVTCDFDTVCLTLKRIQFGATGESSVGDILNVAFWDDEGDNSTVCFDISRFGKRILQAKMQFYGKTDIERHSKL